jgi:hypothetical protein
MHDHDQTPTAREPRLGQSLLEDAPPDDQALFAHELPPRPRRRLLGAGGNPVALSLLAILLTACGFIGGVLVEKGQAKSSPPTTATGGLASRLAALRGGGGAAGRGGGASGGGAPTVGQVSYVSGHTLYVTDFEGNTIKVTAPAGASVTRTVKSSLKSVRPGETVVVTGSSEGDGTIKAQSVRASEAGFGGGLGSALFGGGGPTGGGARGGSSSAGGGTPDGGGGGGEGPVLFGK